MKRFASDISILREGMRRLPVDVVDLIRSFGIEYDERLMPPGVSGFIEHKDGKFLICVNSDESAQRRRFTAAHELSHYLLHRDDLQKHGRMHRHMDHLFDEAAETNPVAPLSRVNEQQANVFAAHILLPFDQLDVRYNRERDNIAELCGTFGVGAAVMRLRLEALGLRPADA